MLLLRHDKENGGNFPLFATHGSWYLNENDPESPNYSIMGDVDKYKDGNGVYHFE